MSERGPSGPSVPWTGEDVSLLIDQYELTMMQVYLAEEDEVVEAVERTASRRDAREEED